MKRAISLILVIILLFSFASCAKKQHGEQQDADSDPTEAPAETATEAATEAPAEEPTDAPEPTDMPAWPEERNDLSRIIQGRDVFFIVRPEGSIYGWGKNDHGQLGTGTREDRYSPAFIASGIEPVRAGETVFALDKDGVLYGWGRNDSGELGNGSREDALAPVELMRNVRWFSDYNFSLITTDDKLYEWAAYRDNSPLSEDEQRENNTPHIVFENVRMTVPSYLVTNDGEIYYNDILDTEWLKLGRYRGSELYPGNYYDFFYRGEDGRLMSWGAEPVVDSFRSVKLMDYTAYVLMNDGRLYAYPYKDSIVFYKPMGELNKLSLITDGVVKFDCGVYEIGGEERGYYRFYALKANGELWSWGYWNDPALGRPDGTDMSEPACVAENVKDFCFNGVQTYAILKDGSVMASGRGIDSGFTHGCLGDGTEETSFGFVPVDIPGEVGRIFTDAYVQFGPEDYISRVEYYCRTFAVCTDGRIFAWGWNGDGFLGVRSDDEEVLVPTEIHLTRG